MSGSFSVSQALNDETVGGNLGHLNQEFRVQDDVWKKYRFIPELAMLEIPKPGESFGSVSLKLYPNSKIFHIL